MNLREKVAMKKENGISIDELCILSDKQQKLNNIEIRSVNQIFKYDLSDHLRIKKRPDIFA